jgi:misacylated tRNA(Ala) deacylase
MTQELFREDSYLKACEATIVGINERGGILLDRTVFYPTAGGQPGDTGKLRLADGSEIVIGTTVYGSDGSLLHVPLRPVEGLAVGMPVTCAIDWERRYRHMRAHTGLHVLCSLVRFPVTGGQVGEAQGRLDFDIPDSIIDKDELTERMNAIIASNRAISIRWITDEEMSARPELVRTMSVKPPMGKGRVRLIEIADCDLQPCGGTHVGSTAEIGRATVTKIEKKGAINRRIRVEFA